MPVCSLRHDAPRNQAQRHEGKAQQQRAVADFIDHFERWQPQQNSGGFLRLQTVLLYKIEQAGGEAEK